MSREFYAAILKRFYIVTLAWVLILTAVSPAALAAGTSPASDGNSIWDGLWRGATFQPPVTNTSSGSNASQPTTNVYAALGDSVAAGLGLPGGDSCGRSTEAYAYTVAAATNLQLVHKACSGATAGDLFTRQGVSGPNLAPQLDAAFANGTPKAISITAGANDIQWDAFLRKCYYGTCGTSFDELASDGLILALKAKLELMFSSIKLRAGGSPPRVVVTGYYTPLSSRCSTIESRLTRTEISWMNSKVSELNRTLSRAVASNSSFAKYAPVSFSGHDICSSDPWVQGIDDSAPFHPTVEGQAAIAKAVIARIPR